MGISFSYVSDQSGTSGTHKVVQPTSFHLTCHPSQCRTTLMSFLTNIQGGYCSPFSNNSW
jgi:hypothetical protein